MSSEGTKLFVGNLPSDSSEEELRQLFETYGTLGDVHVMSSTRSRHGHACAFVVFHSAADADLAVNALNGVHHMAGHGDKGPQTPISVSHARSDDVKNKKTQGKGGGGAAGAHPAYSAEMMSQAYSQAYTQYYAAQAAMMPYMMAQYGAHGAMAPAALQAAYAQAGYGMPAAAAAQLYGYPAMYAHAEAGPEGYDMSSVMLPSLLAQTAMQQEPEAAASHEDTKLFVGGLPPLVTEAEIRMVFGHAGTVKEVHIMQGRSQSGQACAFVVYPDVYSAQLAIRTLNKTPWHAAPDQPPIIVRPADKAQAGGKKTKGKKNQKD